MERTATVLLHEWRAGNEGAFEDLLALMYDELRGLAGREMRGQSGSHTLQPTALVHEAYLRLAGSQSPISDRAHFLGAAATVMRRILIDHARAKKRAKRGGGRVRVTLDADRLAGPEDGSNILDVLALDEAMRRLAEESPRKARAVELHFFGGMTLEEIGTVLEVSVGTVHRDLKLSTAWLHREMTS